MSKYPEALSLAAEVGMYGTPCAKAAAEELRRLHGINEELLEALMDLVDTGFVGGPQLKRARAAIAKATGSAQ